MFSDFGLLPNLLIVSNRKDNPAAVLCQATPECLIFDESLPLLSNLNVLMMLQ